MLHTLSLFVTLVMCDTKACILLMCLDRVLGQTWLGSLRLSMLTWIEVEVVSICMPSCTLVWGAPLWAVTKLSMQGGDRALQSPASKFLRCRLLLGGYLIQERLEVAS